MTTHSGIPVQEIPWTQEPSGLQSLGSQISGYTTSTAGMKTDKQNKIEQIEQWDTIKSPGINPNRYVQLTYD